MAEGLLIATQLDQRKVILDKTGIKVSAAKYFMFIKSMILQYFY